MPDNGGAFLSVLVSLGLARHAAPCRILVGDVVVIECESESRAIAVETAIRAAVVACGSM